MLAVLVVLSLALLATGTHGSLVHKTIRTVVSVTTYPFLKTLKSIESASGYVSGLILSYDASRKDLEAARVQLAEMTLHDAEREELTHENRRLREMLRFVRNESGFTLEPVRVLESFKGVVVVDRGTAHGVRESMCAIAKDGIVGLVTQTDPLSSGVVTLYHADCKIGAMIARNRVRGVVHGANSELNPYCTMNYIDMKDDVQVGDAVVASPESIFPAGFPIGRVVSVHETGSLWKTADIEPAVDPYGLDEIFILRQAAPSEKELAARSAKESSEEKAEAQPDRSMQERYAP
jgi:rod shape-determining protein MreC